MFLLSLLEPNPLVGLSSFTEPQEYKERSSSAPVKRGGVQEDGNQKVFGCLGLGPFLA